MKLAEEVVVKRLLSVMVYRKGLSKTLDFPE